MNDAQRAALETMIAWREALEKTRPGTRKWEIIEREFRKAETEYHKAKE